MKEDWFNTFAPRLTQVVRAKTADRMWLCMGISLTWQVLQTWSKPQKTQQVL